MEVAPGVHRFPSGAFNWYVIEEAGRLTVVDAGFPGHYELLLAGIAGLGLGIKDVEAVLITHAHADHVGFAERLRRESGAPVFVHRDDRLKIGRPLQLPWTGLISNAWRSYTRRMLLHATANGVFGLPSVSRVSTFEDGITLDVPGRPRVIHVPGHTAGEVAFHLADRHTLITGDTLVTRDLYTGANVAPSVPSRLLNVDDQTARRSIARLSEVGQVTMLPGHGEPWKGSMAEAVALANAAA